MKKFKFLIALLIVPLLISACSCQKQPTDRDHVELLVPDDVKGKVKDWVVYTNPAFRYELRSPENWEILDLNKTGEDVYFYEKGKSITDDYKGELRILGFSNWLEKLSIDEFIKSKAPTNYYAISAGEDRQEIQFRDFYAIRFDNVEIAENQLIDVLAIDGRDRIILIELRGTKKDIETILGSMYFY
ncbi:MAG: hypothetical protein ACOZBH_01395 [Patescibacteria group bacterium]